MEEAIFLPRFKYVCCECFSSYERTLCHFKQIICRHHMNVHVDCFEFEQSVDGLL